MSSPTRTEDSDSDGAITIYTDDELNERVFLDLVARLQVSDTAPSTLAQSGRRRRTENNDPGPPPVPQNTRPVPPAPNRRTSLPQPVLIEPVPSPPSSPAPALPQTPLPLATPSRLYAYQSRLSPPTQTTHWHEAAAATQKVPGGLPRALLKHKKKKWFKAAAYAVIRGTSAGVYDSWDGPDGARQYTERFPFALYAGYPSRAAAQAAFDFSVTARWNSTSPVLSIPRDRIPRPIRDKDDLEGHAPRQPGDAWYVVFIGVHPGIYPASVEALLNVLGVSGASHDSWPTYEEARNEFDDAVAAGTTRRVNR
ncbi:hypothetical protein C8F01DRAFT_1263312 [Mycena amicta]|nr:hypothetical protein C8F01DRAFT_1263312 [Mycena amicta]